MPCLGGMARKRLGASVLLPRELLVVVPCDRHAELLLMPVPQRLRIFRAEEYSANARDFLHGPKCIVVISPPSICRATEAQLLNPGDIYGPIQGGR